MACSSIRYKSGLCNGGCDMQTKSSPDHKIRAGSVQDPCACYSRLTRNMSIWGAEYRTDTATWCTLQCPAKHRQLLQVGMSNSPSEVAPGTHSLCRECLDFGFDGPLLDPVPLVRGSSSSGAERGRKGRFHADFHVSSRDSGYEGEGNDIPRIAPSGVPWKVIMSFSFFTFCLSLAGCTP